MESVSGGVTIYEDLLYLLLGQQKEDGKYPNLAKKCRQYYACSDGEMIQLKMCDEGTVFDIQRYLQKEREREISTYLYLPICYKFTFFEFPPRLSCERPVYVAPPCGSALYSLTDYTKSKKRY